MLDVPDPGPPPRPGAWEERAAHFLLRALAPRLARMRPPEPPGELAPFERFAVSRPGRVGTLAATWYPAGAGARGAVLLVHPWMEWGQAYFHRRGRIEALRAAGYHAMAFDLGGFGGSGPAIGLWDRDVEDALAALRERAPGLPLHLWGVSSGGYWAHPVLARNGAMPAVMAAMFEDVSPHLLEWSTYMAPAGRPFYGIFRRCLRRAHPYLDMRRHAPHLRLRAVAYAGGDADRGIPAADTRELARLADGECLIVPGAGHLAAIKRAPGEVVACALRTFERGGRGRPA